MQTQRLTVKNTSAELVQFSLEISGTPIDLKPGSICELVISGDEEHQIEVEFSPTGVAFWAYRGDFDAAFLDGEPIY